MSVQTRDQLQKIASVPCLYRHEENRSFYGIKKQGGKIVKKALKKEAGVPITNLQEAKLALNAWILSLTGEKPTVKTPTTEFRASDLLSRAPRSLDDLQKMIAAAKNIPTLGGCFDRFQVLKAGNSKNTLEKYKYMKRAFELYGGTALLNKTISQITTSELVEFFVNFPAEKKPQYFNTFSLVVNQVFEMARMEKLIKENPLNMMPKSIRRRKVKTIRDQVPTIEQCEQIVASIRSQKAADTRHESANLCAFMHLAALGEAEADFLTWADIDFKDEVIRAKRIKTSKHFDVPMYPFLKPFLEDLAEKKPNRKPSDKIFKVKSIQKALYAACKRLNLPAYSPRDLRKARITWLLRKGYPVELIADAQGHVDGGVLIRRVYANVIDESKDGYKKEQLKKLAQPKATRKKPGKPGEKAVASK